MLQIFRGDVCKGEGLQYNTRIPMVTNCARFLADIFLYSYETEFIQSLLPTVKKKVSISVQSHSQVHQWCIVHKQPRIRKLYGPDVSC